MSIIKNAIGLAASVLMLVTGLVYAQDVKTIDTPLNRHLHRWRIFLI